MRKLIIRAVGLLLLLTIAWPAFREDRSEGAAQSGAQRSAQMREAQLKTITQIQENVAKLKSILEATSTPLEGRSFQLMSDEERSKIREAFTKRREEQTKLIAAIEQELMKLKSFRQLRTEQEDSVASLKELLASAQKENAKETASKLEQMIAKREKDFEDKIKKMGFDPSQMSEQEQKPVGPGGKINPSDAKATEAKPRAPNAALVFDTKGTPLKVAINASDGKQIGQMDLFGEGTSIICLDAQQHLILENDRGDIIAGFTSVAFDPAEQGITQCYIVEEEDGSRSVMLEHEVATIQYKGGVLTLRNPQLEMLTSVKVRGNQLTVRFKSLDQLKDDNGRITNRLTISEGDQSFEFIVRPSSSSFHMLKPHKGDLAHYLAEKKRQMERESLGQNQ